jgi:hypothetical protein
VIAGVISKCLGAPKARTRELGIDILLMFVEVEKQDMVLEELVKGLDQKNPKAVVGCILALTAIVRFVISRNPLFRSSFYHKDQSIESKSRFIHLFSNNKEDLFLFTGISARRS